MRLEQWEVDGARDRVVVQGSGDELAGGVIDDLLQQRLADALGHSTVDLPPHERRADDDPTVVNRDELHHLHFTRVGKDLDDRDVGAKRKCLIVRAEVLGRFQPAPNSAGSSSE